MKRIAALIGLVAAAWALARRVLGPGSEPGPPLGPPAAPPAGGFADDGPVDLSSASKAELYEQAKRLGIEGRSKMSRDELAQAVGRARSG